MEEIKKPITMLQAEFRSNLISLINDSGLYPFVILHILKETYGAVAEIAQQQLNADTVAYQKKLAELQSKTSE